MAIVHIISDIHLEFTKNFYIHASPKCDVVVVAGDLSPITKNNIGIDWLVDNFDVPIIYVAGNHEYYNYPYTVEKLEDYLREQLSKPKYQNIHFLQNESIELLGAKFIGSTLWTDYNLYNTKSESMSYAELYMNDFRNISFDGFINGTPGKAQKFLDIHNESLEYLITELSIPYNGNTVVISHHCPAPGSIHERFLASPLNPAFTTDLTHVIKKLSPNYWIHGHTHSSFNYMVGDTQIICNPLGYMWINNHGFVQRENEYYRGDLVIHV